jgi:hypothetical protein
MELLPYLFVACLTVWQPGLAAPGGDPTDGELAAGYALDELHGPFVRREQGEAATCASPDALRIVVQGETPEEARLSLETLFPTEPRP